MLSFRSETERVQFKCIPLYCSVGAWGELGKKQGPEFLVFGMGQASPINNILNNAVCN